MRITHKYLKENQDTIDWYEISKYKFFTNESNIRKWKDKVDWNMIISNQVLSEPFIREFKENVNWNNISAFQILSEPFIREFKDMVDWYQISYYQVLSEDFIKEFEDQLNWENISDFQKLSEPFISEFKNEIDWYYISARQKLSEDFIREFKDEVNWENISSCQVLSEDFIKEFEDEVNWLAISSCQHLTPKFRKEFNLPDITPEPSREEKVQAMSSYAKQWRLKFDGEFLFAYRNHDRWGRGMWNKTIIYSPGNYYQDWHCDYNKNEENSFGFGIWPEGNVPVKISIDDFGIVVNRKDGKCRVKGFTVLE